MPTQTRYPQTAENLKRIADNAANAAAKYRGSDEKIDIMAVTKTVDPDKINFAIECGITLLGENRVQEYLSKKDSYDKRGQVQFIGHLQTNKVKYIINDVTMIQSVDSLKLAGEINRLAEKNGRVMDILLEVNIGGEETKSGVDKDQLFVLAEQAAELKNLRLKGLMAIPPVGCGEEVFEQMRELFEALKSKKLANADISVLSMGMSGDYETAIKHGSTLVRIGSALFGARDYTKKQ